MTPKFLSKGEPSVCTAVESSLFGSQSARPAFSSIDFFLGHLSWHLLLQLQPTLSSQVFQPLPKIDFLSHLPALNSSSRPVLVLPGQVCLLVPSVFLPWVFKHCLLLPHFLLSKGWQLTRAPPCYHCTFFLIYPHLLCAGRMLPPTVGGDPLIPLMCLCLSPAPFRAVVLHTGCKRHRLGNSPAVLETWFDPWVGKIPWRREWQPTPVFLLGESPWTEESMGSQRIGHDWVTKHWRDLILGNVQGSPLVIVITDYHTVVGGSARGGCSFARLVLESSPGVVAITDNHLCREGSTSLLLLVTSHQITRRTSREVWLPREEELGGGVRSWDEQLKAFIFRMDEQQGPTV